MPKSNWESHLLSLVVRLGEGEKNSIVTHISTKTVTKDCLQSIVWPTDFTINACYSCRSPVLNDLIITFMIL